MTTRGSRAVTAGSIRADNRERLTNAILDTARTHLARDGAAGLSLRAVARDLGMASSAVYRYFASRDELLTRLIIEAYDSLGAAAETADARVARSDLGGRFRAICHAVRDWALSHPNEYFLIYGTPVPGYQAPTDTIAPATRVATLLITLLVELATASAGERRDETSAGADRVGATLGQAASSDPALGRAPIRSQVPESVPDAQLVRGLGMFSALFGAISFELGGQLHNVITETKTSRRAFFDALVTEWLARLGLSQPLRGSMTEC